MAEDSTQKLSWMAETSSNWIHVTPSNGVGSMEVTVKLDEAEATETELDGTIIFKCTEPGFEGIQKTVSVNREACKKKCEVDKEFRRYQPVTYPDDFPDAPGNVDKCGGSVTIKIPYIDWKTYKDACKESEQTPGEATATFNIPKNIMTTGDVVYQNTFNYPESTTDPAEPCIVIIKQYGGPCIECDCGNFRIGSTSVEIKVNETTGISYSLGCTTGLQISAADTEKVMAYEENGQIKIEGKKIGSTTVTVTAYAGETPCEKTISVTVKKVEYEITFDKQVDCSGGTVTFEAVPINN